MKPLVTQSQLIGDLKKLGIVTGDLVMVHAALGKIGWLVGGPQIVIQALKTVIGPTGTIMMYVGWQDSPYTMRGWSSAKKATYLAECPAYDPRIARAVVDWSLLAEVFRTWPGTLRSAHPDGSFCANGPKAKRLVSGHALKFGYGDRSPLAKFTAQTGKVLLLGAPLSTVTLLHYAESVCKLDHKPTVTYQVPILKAGQRVLATVTEYDTERGILKGYKGDYFEAIVSSYLGKKQMQPQLVGSAPTYLFDSGDLVQYALHWLEQWSPAHD